MLCMLCACKFIAAKCTFSSLLLASLLVTKFIAADSTVGSFLELSVGCANGSRKTQPDCRHKAAWQLRPVFRTSDWVNICHTPTAQNKALVAIVHFFNFHCNIRAFSSYLCNNLWIDRETPGDATSEFHTESIALHRIGHHLPLAALSEAVGAVALLLSFITSSLVSLPMPTLHLHRSAQSFESLTPRWWHSNQLDRNRENTWGQMPSDATHCLSQQDSCFGWDLCLPLASRFPHPHQEHPSWIVWQECLVLCFQHWMRAELLRSSHNNHNQFGVANSFSSIA